MIRKLYSLFASFIFAFLLLSAAVPAFAANVSLDLSGTPTSVKQGDSANFTITVSATGNINLSAIPATVSVNTAYTVNGSSGTADSSSIFSAPDDPNGNPACDAYHSGPNTGTCRPSQTIAGGPYPITATVSVPSDLAPGEYLVTISATATNGLSLPNPMPTFSLIVDPAGSAPTINIITPANGGSYKVNEPVTASVEIVTDSALSDVSCSLNGNSVTLEYNSEDNDWEAPLVLSTPGANNFHVEATNDSGTTKADSNFTTHYDFGGWLPPITTAKFQNGRTLPVKFRINDYNGFTGNAIAAIKLDGIVMGDADILYDSIGPYYQKNITLNGVGSHTVGLSLDDLLTNQACVIIVK